MGIIFAIFAATLLGVGNVFLKKSFKSFSPSVDFFIFSIFSFILLMPMGLILGVDFGQWLLGVSAGIISAIFGQAIYIYVLEKGELSITATILATFSVYTIIFSILFNHESPTPLVLFFIVLTVLGTIIVSFPERFDKKDLSKVNIIAWAVFAAVCIGASDTFTKFFITKASVGSFLFYVAIAQVVVSFIYLKYDKQPLNQVAVIFKKVKDYKFALLGSISIAVSTMFLFLSFNLTLASITSPIVASAPIITVILAVIFLKDKLSPKNLVGLIIVIVSVIAIGFLNP